MEYPLGANNVSGACKPTLRPAVRSGIQNPALRHPRSNAGSQKRLDTAFAEVLLRARRSPFLHPPHSIPTFFSQITLFFAPQVENRENPQDMNSQSLVSEHGHNWSLIARMTAGCHFTSRKYPSQSLNIVAQWLPRCEAVRQRVA